MKYLSAPPTCIASEQLFSPAGQIFAVQRSNLLGENADKTIVSCTQHPLIWFQLLTDYRAACNADAV